MTHEPTMFELVCLCDNNGIRQGRDVKQTNPTPHGSTSTRLGQSHHAASHWNTLVKAVQLLPCLAGPATRWHAPPYPVSLDEKSTFAVPICCSVTENSLSSREQDDCILSRNILPFDVWWMY